jgi:hypothetical protein
VTGCLLHRTGCLDIGAILHCGSFSVYRTRPGGRTPTRQQQERDLALRREYYPATYLLCVTEPKLLEFLCARMAETDTRFGRFQVPRVNGFRCLRRHTPSSSVCDPCVVQHCALEAREPQRAGSVDVRMNGPRKARSSSQSPGRAEAGTQMKGLCFVQCGGSPESVRHRDRITVTSASSKCRALRK